MSYYRTPEHRALRAKLIGRWRPWEKSTGPKSAEGKAKIARNGYKGGIRKKIRELSKVLKEQREGLKKIKLHSSGGK